MTVLLANSTDIGHAGSGEHSVLVAVSDLDFCAVRAFPKAVRAGCADCARPSDAVYAACTAVGERLPGEDGDNC